MKKLFNKKTSEEHDELVLRIKKMPIHFKSFLLDVFRKEKLPHLENIAPLKQESEVILTGQDFGTGYADLIQTYEYQTKYQDGSHTPYFVAVLIEVKSRPIEYGSDLRQIKTYAALTRLRRHNDIFDYKKVISVIVSKENKYEKELLEEGVYSFTFPKVTMNSF